MNRRLSAAFFVGLACTLYGGPASAQSLDDLLKVVDRFSGQVTVAQGSVATVSAHDWIIPNQHTVKSLPEQGLLVVELRSGITMTTIINGKSEMRNEGDIWIVPAGSTMSIQTARYSVTLHVVAVRASPRLTRSDGSAATPRA